MLVRLPDESILEVPLVWIAVVALRVPLTVRVSAASPSKSVSVVRPTLLPSMITLSTVQESNPVPTPAVVMSQSEESMAMLPVVSPPMVKVWFSVVWITPAEFRTMLPEIEAVGVPESTLIKANLADEVEVPPIRRSRVSLMG